MSIRALVTVVFLVSLSSTANADLFSRLGGQAVYDSDQNLTWIADAHLAASNTFGVSGIGTFSPGAMDWPVANAWIAAMNASFYLGFNDWRLPQIVQPDITCSIHIPGLAGGFDAGFGCTASEMPHLVYVDLLGVGGSSIGNSGNGLPNPYMGFQNIQWGSIYWSGTPNTHDASGNPITPVFSFDFGFNDQRVDQQPFLDQAWAVRTGDVGDVAAVPEPGSLILLMLGLGLISVVVPRRA